MEYKNMTVLHPPQIEEALRSLPGWRLEGGALVCDFVFADFVQAFAFVTQLALLAEKEGHHPDLDLRYNRVHLWRMQFKRCRDLRPRRLRRPEPCACVESCSPDCAACWWRLSAYWP
jgi:4a-hydroxytetrahydrobiopterin dehydratase